MKWFQSYYEFLHITIMLIVYDLSSYSQNAKVLKKVENFFKLFFIKLYFRRHLRWTIEIGCLYLYNIKTNLKYIIVFYEKYKWLAYKHLSNIFWCKNYNLGFFPDYNEPHIFIFIWDINTYILRYQFMWNISNPTTWFDILESFPITYIFCII